MTVRVKEIGARNKENTEVRDRAEGHVHGANDLSHGVQGRVQMLRGFRNGGRGFIKGS